MKILHFVEGSLPMKYLGIPLISAKLFIRNCKVPVEKLRLNVNNWKYKYLSYTRRLQLISSVLSSLPPYWVFGVLLGKSTTKDIGKTSCERAQLKFLGTHFLNQKSLEVLAFKI